MVGTSGSGVWGVEGASAAQKASLPSRCPKGHAPQRGHCWLRRAPRVGALPRAPDSLPVLFTEQLVQTWLRPGAGDTEVSQQSCCLGVTSSCESQDAYQP